MKFVIWLVDLKYYFIAEKLCTEKKEKSQHSIRMHVHWALKSFSCGRNIFKLFNSITFSAIAFVLYYLLFIIDLYLCTTNGPQVPKISLVF